jgi:hypothetical protein
MIVGEFNVILSHPNKNQQRNLRIKWHHRSNGLNIHPQSMACSNSTIDIFLSSPWNFLQNRSYFRKQRKSYQFKKIGITCCILLDHNTIKLELKTKETRENIQTHGD